MNNSREKQIRKDVVQFYDTISHQFSQTRRNWWEGLEFIKKYLHKNDRVLDFGCGNGRFLEMVYAEKMKIEYLGADVSEGMIDIARGHYMQEEFQLIPESGKLELPEKSFDAAVSIAVFHHLSPKMAARELEELRKVLKDDGVLIITVWNLWSWKRVKFLITSRLRRFWKLGLDRSAYLPFNFHSKEGKFTHWRFCHFWSKRSLAKLIRRAGFTILESGYSFDKRNQKRNIYFAAKKKQ